jgi:hypothetical protein
MIGLLLKFSMIRIIAFLLLIACTKGNQDEVVPVSEPVVANPLRVINVSTASELKAALGAAQPGDEIILADGIYKGRFVIPATANGSISNKIMLRGNRSAVLDGESITTGYVLHLQASHWIIKGITLTNGLKGLMTDGASFNTIDSIKVHNIGEEAIPLRRFSSNNTIQFAEISHTGLKTPDYGEGIYIGSTKNNWAAYSNGLPDRCDSNMVSENKIGPAVTAECIDIKEGTTGGIIRGNYFDATGITGANSADSWIDVKGNYYLIESNKGYNPTGSLLKDGCQVNVAYSRWGNFNEFKNNTCQVNAAGYGFLIKLSSSNGTAMGNKVYANNQVNDAASGVSNIPLSN